MNDKYLIDRQFGDLFIPDFKRILGPLLLEPADFDLDAHEATDMVILTARDMRIACRVRRHGYAERWPWQFTLRSKRDSGAVTELRKIVDGWGDWHFYGHANVDNHLVRWFVIDLHAFRAHLIRRDIAPSSMGQKSNNDGTHFSWFDVRGFPPNPAILIASSHTVPAVTEVA